MQMNRVLRICLAGLLVLGVAGTSTTVLTSCTPTQTATMQIKDQTNDPYVIADAAYLDALKFYNDLAERYLRYAPYIERHRPDIHMQVLAILREMDRMLVTWEGFKDAGVVPNRLGTELTDYGNIIIDLLLQVDNYIEENGETL